MVSSNPADMLSWYRDECNQGRVNMVLKRVVNPPMFATNEDAEIKTSKVSSTPRLFPIHFCPSWLQFNKFVLSGYRCNLTTSECLTSLTYLHNESVNIYSHGIPFILFMVFIPLTASEACLRMPFWFSFHYVACFAPMFASLIYHLFMCHHTGAQTYSNLLCFDMCGIWVVNSLGALCGIRATLFCFPIWRKLAVIVYLMISFYSLSYILKAPTPKERLIPFAVFGVLRYIFLMVRLTLQFLGYGCGTPDALYYCVIMDCCACLGGVINIARIPEKWFPGYFDIVGNSHQIMHVLTALSVMFLHFGSTKEFEWMDSFDCTANK